MQSGIHFPLVVLQFFPVAHVQVLLHTKEVFVAQSGSCVLVHVPPTHVCPDGQILLQVVQPSPQFIPLQLAGQGEQVPPIHCPGGQTPGQVVQPSPQFIPLHLSGQVDAEHFPLIHCPGGQTPVQVVQPSPQFIPLQLFGQVDPSVHVPPTHDNPVGQLPFRFVELQSVDCGIIHVPFVHTVPY